MANFNFNKVMLGGRLTADPELKTTQNNINVVTFSIAVNRNFRSKDAAQQADFFNVTAWRATADFVSRYFRKGSSIFIVGSIQNRSWTDQQGQKRYATDIIAEDVQFVDSRSENSSAPAQQPHMPEAYAAPAYSNQAGMASNFEDIKTDDDLPF